jgi:hypothetical protein
MFGLNSMETEGKIMTTKKATKKRGRPPGSKGGGGKLARSETITVRLDPKLRFIAELSARKHRRTLSSFIEWAVEEAVGNVVLSDANSINPVTALQAMNEVWDVDEPDRFVKMAFHYPNLLTHKEETLFKLISECGYLWEKKNKDGNKFWDISPNSIIFERLREFWEVFQGVADGRLPKERLPSAGREIIF